MEPDDLADVWRALGSPVRRRILDHLHAGPRTTGALAAEFPDLSRFAVMQHLGVLVAAGLVVVRREGRERWNHLNPVPIRRVYERWMSRYEDVWAAELTSLRARAESQAAPPSRRAPSAPRKAPARASGPQEDLHEPVG